MAQASTLVPVTKMKKAPTMAQVSTLVPVTKMKKAQAWTLALSWGNYVIILLRKLKCSRSPYFSQTYFANFTLKLSSIICLT